MPKKGKGARVQHYVPQFILRSFAADRADQVWVFDKATGQKFKTNTKNVAGETRFHDPYIEEALERMETKAAGILRPVVRDASLANLGTADRLFLSVFFAIQFLRTRQRRRRWEQLSQDLVETARARGIGPVGDYSPTTEDETRLFAMAALLRADELAPLFMSKAWMLFSTEATRPFQIGDNPIAMQNMHDHHPYGNIGLGVKGIEIYFPMSRELTLGVWCASLAAEIRQGYKNYKRLRQSDSAVVERIVRDPLGLERLAVGIETGQAIRMTDENVTNHNSLQVEWAARFLFSSTDDFSLAERMLKDNPKYREGGPKITIG